MGYMASAVTLAIADMSPASASTAASATTLKGLEQFDSFRIDASLLGATGGTLDVYLQRRILDTDGTTEIWVDWLHFPQLAAGASAVKYTCIPGTDTSIFVVGQGTTVALAQNTCTGGHPGGYLRAVYVAGASTSAGAAQVIKVTGWKGTR